MLKNASGVRPLLLLPLSLFLGYAGFADAQRAPLQDRIVRLDGTIAEYKADGITVNDVQIPLPPVAKDTVQHWLVQDGDSPNVTLLTETNQVYQYSSGWILLAEDATGIALLGPGEETLVRFRDRLELYREAGGKDILPTPAVFTSTAHLATSASGRIVMWNARQLAISNWLDGWDLVDAPSRTSFQEIWPDGEGVLALTEDRYGRRETIERIDGGWRASGQALPVRQNSAGPQTATACEWRLQISDWEEEKVITIVQTGGEVGRVMALSARTIANKAVCRFTPALEMFPNKKTYNVDLRGCGNSSCTIKVGLRQGSDHTKVIFFFHPKTGDSEMRAVLMNRINGTAVTAPGQVPVVLGQAGDDGRSSCSVFLDQRSTPYYSGTHYVVPMTVTYCGRTEDIRVLGCRPQSPVQQLNWYTKILTCIMEIGENDSTTQ